MNLQNNSNEMKTVVETFVIEETAELIYDNEKLDKWNELVNELGLSGQTKIVKPEKSPIPFMHMKQSIVKTFECLCPRKVDVKGYDVTPIPVEILDLISLSIKEKYFDKIQIWYDDKNPDPLCVGIKSTYYCYNHSYSTVARNLTYDEANKMKTEDPNVMGYNSSEDRLYLLGKWADVKHSFEELKQMATKRYISEKTVRLKTEMKKLQRELDDIQLEAIGMFNPEIKSDFSTELPF